MVYCSREIVCP